MNGPRASTFMYLAHYAVIHKVVAFDESKQEKARYRLELADRVL
jgi:hypothetical protein